MSGRDIVKKARPTTDALWGASLKFYDKDRQYKEEEVAYARPRSLYETTKSTKKVRLNTGATMNRVIALKQCANMVSRAQTDLDSYEFTIQKSQLAVEPGAIVRFPFKGLTVDALVNSTAITGSFNQDLYVTTHYKAINFNYVPDEPPEDPGTVVGNETTYFKWLDGPAIYETDHSAGSLRQYAVLYGPSDWTGGGLYKSDTGETGTFSTIGGINTNPLVGKVTQITGSKADAGTTDKTNTLSVVFISGDPSGLESISWGQFYAAQRVAYVGKEGRWVKVLLKDVTVDGINATFSNIIWGVQGSESFIDQIAVQDDFILIDPFKLISFLENEADAGETRYYKASADGSQLFSVEALPRTINQIVETPLAPANLIGVQNGAAIDLSWDWRVRYGFEQVFVGAADAVYSEDALEFEIDILDNGSPQAVIRTVTGITTNSYTYPGPDITTDFGSQPATLTWRVYMISTAVGRGYVAETTSQILPA